jgi:hypothetical protein
VIPGSAADQGSGLQPGDLILAVNGVHISDWDEDKLLEAFRGEDIIGSKCRLTIERPEAKHLGPVDVEVLRTNASFAKEVELLSSLARNTRPYYNLRQVTTPSMRRYRPLCTRRSLSNGTVSCMNKYWARGFDRCKWVF